MICLYLVEKNYEVATGQGEIREILGFVKEIWNYVESQGNLRKFIFYKRLR